MMHRSNALVAAVACAAALWAPPSTAREKQHQHGTAHEHGVAVLEVSVDGSTLAIRLEAPMESVVGFEHAPKTAAQRDRLEKARRELADPFRLFVPSPQAQCALREARAESVLFESGAAGAVAAGGHSDLEYAVTFDCAKPALLNGLEVRALKVFAPLQQVRAQVAGRSGQTSQRLTKQRTGLKL